MIAAVSTELPCQAQIEQDLSPILAKGTSTDLLEYVAGIMTQCQQKVLNDDSEDQKGEKSIEDSLCLLIAPESSQHSGDPYEMAEKIAADKIQQCIDLIAKCNES